MKQTNATFLVDDGVLMADNNQVVSIAQARVTVEPIDEPSSNAALEKVINEAVARMDKAATRLMKWFIIACALYLLAEIAFAFATGAIPAVR